MSVLDDLRKLSAAEEFFAYLGVPYDPGVLQVARLHILRRLADTLPWDTLAALDESAVRARCRAHLEAAYADLVAHRPLDLRVFKVLQSASLIPAAALSRKPPVVTSH